LSIEDVLMTDAGKVKCIVLNENGDQVLESEANLNVNEMPVSIVRGLSNVKCMEKEEAKFSCKLNKEVKPEDVKWFKDDVELTDDMDGITFESDGVKQNLIIDKAKLDDSGTFTIKVKDANSSAKLKVKGNLLLK
jgi:hypothetical protein